MLLLEKQYIKIHNVVVAKKRCLHWEQELLNSQRVLFQKTLLSSSLYFMINCQGIYLWSVKGQSRPRNNNQLLFQCLIASLLSITWEVVILILFKTRLILVQRLQVWLKKNWLFNFKKPTERFKLCEIDRRYQWDSTRSRPKAIRAKIQLDIPLRSNN